MTEDEDEVAEQRARAKIGRVLDGRYELRSVLGIGGLGAVYRAQHLGLQREVAVKLLHDEFSHHEELRRRFEREARVLSTLDHEHIVRVVDFGETDGISYLAMELLEGKTLRDLIEDRLPTIDTTFDLTRQMVRGLAYAHSQGVLHRDLKPSNVFLLPRDGGGHHVKIVDFGLAKMAEAEDGQTITRIGTILGTPSYMSPEQVASQRADARADVYSMGIILYEMLTGRCPFENENDAVLMRAHLVEPVPPPSSMCEGLVLTPELETFISEALAKHRENRFEDGAEMLEALQALPDPPATRESTSVRRTATGDEPTMAATPTPQRTTPIAKTQAMAGVAPRLPEKVAKTAPLPKSPPLRSPTRRRIVTAAVVLAGASVLATTFLFVDGDGETVTPPLNRPVPTHADDAAVPPPSGALVDPFADVPAALRPAHRKVSRGTELSAQEIRALRVYQRRHADDARPSLLLAHDYANRSGWQGALERYRIAMAKDPATRGSPWMIADLIRMAGTDDFGGPAAAAIEEFYGAEGLPHVERALEDNSLAPPARRRLAALRRRLR